MTVSASSPSQESPRNGGAWRLLPGQALTLRPSQSGVLWVIAGSLWATNDGPHRGAGNDRGDRVLTAGESVDLRAGERLVLEPVGADARFGWDPAPPWPARRRSASALLWRAAMLVPAFGLTAAMWLGAAATSEGHRIDVAGARNAVQPAAVQCATGHALMRGHDAPA